MVGVFAAGPNGPVKFFVQMTRDGAQRRNVLRLIEQHGAQQANLPSTADVVVVFGQDPVEAKEVAPSYLDECIAAGDILPVPSHQAAPRVQSRRAGGRQGFSNSEELAMLDFERRHRREGYSDTALWKKATAEKVTTHSFESMRNHWKHQLKHRQLSDRPWQRFADDSADGPGPIGAEPIDSAVPDSAPGPLAEDPIEEPAPGPLAEDPIEEDFGEETLLESFEDPFEAVEDTLEELENPAASAVDFVDAMEPAESPADSPPVAAPPAEAPPHEGPKVVRTMADALAAVMAEIKPCLSLLYPLRMLLFAHEIDAFETVEDVARGLLELYHQGKEENRAAFEELFAAGDATPILEAAEAVACFGAAPRPGQGENSIDKAGARAHVAMVLARVENTFKPRPKRARTGAASWLRRHD